MATETLQLADALPMANTLTALATLLPRAGDKATLERAAKLLKHVHDLCVESAFEQAINELAQQIHNKGVSIADVRKIAQLCQTCAVLCEDEAESVGILLAVACDLLLRQHLMLEQAKLLPVQEFTATGRAH